VANLQVDAAFVLLTAGADALHCSKAQQICQGPLTTPADHLGGRIVAICRGGAGVTVIRGMIIGIQ
jgi:hypothetical protein